MLSVHQTQEEGRIILSYHQSLLLLFLSFSTSEHMETQLL